jgi:ribosomal protein S18 acetylase RimI-like enzyme
MSEPNILIRRLGRDDLSILERVAADVFDFEVDARLSAEFLADPRHHLMVALADGKVVGFASGVHYIHPDKPAELFVNEVGVAPVYRHRGIGRRLLSALLEHGKAMGCRQAWVATEPQNAPARALYASAGGKESPGPFVMVLFELEAGLG